MLRKLSVSVIRCFKHTHASNANRHKIFQLSCFERSLDIRHFHNVSLNISSSLGKRVLGNSIDATPSFRTPLSTSLIRNASTSTKESSISSDSENSHIIADVEDNGKKYYDWAKEHLAKHEKEEQEKEEKKQEEQYTPQELPPRVRAARAKAQARDPTGSAGAESKGSGIQVIKTIVKQTRRERSKQFQEIKVTASSPDLNQSDLEKARECMQLSAFEYGFNDALVSLANHALSNSRNFDAKSEFKYAMTIDDASTPSQLKLLKNSISNTKNGAQVAIQLYQFAGDDGSKEGLFNLGHLYWTGHNHDEDPSSKKGAESSGIEVGLEPNEKLALECFEKSAELGDNDARYFLGVHYLQESLDDIRIRGLELVQRSADNGHAGALYYLALLHRNGEGSLDIEPSLGSFREYLDESAEGGDNDGLYLRAHCQFHGEDGYAVDYVAAFDGFVQAGVSGNAAGFVSAGAMLHQGVGSDIEKDQRRAFDLYQQAGELGSTDGWRNVVSCYVSGEGVPKCEQTAKYITKTMLSPKSDQ
mmetsp:Transcript_16211/g.24315  ORF Transcript_16211/g.24315 Transcript_16211/m.24315 type:complete len:531 (+) Transcript_16211:73-1665(+)